MIPIPDDDETGAGTDGRSGRKGETWINGKVMRGMLTPVSCLTLYIMINHATIPCLCACNLMMMTCLEEGEEKATGTGTVTGRGAGAGGWVAGTSLSQPSLSPSPSPWYIIYHIHQNMYIHLLLLLAYPFCFLLQPSFHISSSQTMYAIIYTIFI